LKILLVHNSYQQPGGEDVVFNQERRLLESTGYDVVTFLRSNHEIAQYSTLQRLRLAKQAIWTHDVREEIRARLRRDQPDIVHVHNTFPMISPSIYYACQDARIPVIQTLHNYRLMCPDGTFFRSGKICEECVEHSLWRGIRYGCYRRSRAATATVALMLAVHRTRGTWAQMVDCYVALTRFAQNKFIAAGLPQGKIIVKPNFVQPDPGEGNETREYAAFVGRLVPHKGLRTLLAGWMLLKDPVPLRIVGGGPLQQEVQEHAADDKRSEVLCLGNLPRDQTIAIIKKARFLVFPSEWYETFGLTIAEAFACGTPVICSRLGAMQEIVDDGQTGLHFTAGHAEDLARKVGWAWSNPERMRVMGYNARAEYEAKYTGERNHQMLIDIYQRVLGSKKVIAPRPEAA
jgi:glycosyltransferase involved in cell wall biosynthesis